MWHKQKKIAMWFISIFLAVFGGFIAGQSYIKKAHNQVFILQESKLLKLVSLGIAAEDMSSDQSDQNSASNTLSEGDKQKVREMILKLDSILKHEYSHNPIIIDKKGQWYEIYGSAKQVDITQEVIIKLIGKKRWDLIGKSLLK